MRHKRTSKELTGFSIPAFSKCVISLHLFIPSPPILLGDGRGGGVCAPYFVAMDTTNTPHRKLHRIISGQLRLFALQQTSGLEAFACQRHKLFLCLQGNEEEGQERRGKQGNGTDVKRQLTLCGNRFVSAQ